MAIVRPPMAWDGLTPVPNSWMRDSRLSWKAKGLLANIVGHAPGYELTVKQLIEDGTDGKDAVLSGLRELETAGYLVRTRLRDQDGTWGAYDYEVRDPSPSQSGSNQGGKIRTGGDQAKGDVPAGGDQGGFSGADNPPTKKTTSKKTREDHSAPTERDADGEEDQDTPNAGSIVADWIDYCGGRGIKLTKQSIGRYAGKIKELLKQGFTEKQIKHALNLQLARGKAAFPAMLDSFIVEVQAANVPRPTSAPPAPRYPSAAERAEDRREDERAIAEIADRLAAEQGSDPSNPVENMRIGQLARQIHASRSTSCQPTGYTVGQTGVIDAEWTEAGHPTATPRLEVTAQ